MGEDRVLFDFGHRAEKEKVIWKGPWSFHRNLVVLRSIGKDEDPMAVDLNICGFYVQVTGVPFSGNSIGIAKIIGNKLGSFVAFDENNQSGLATTLRMRVGIDITKQLYRCITIEGPRKQPIQLQVSYERLPNFCYYCGIIGHLVKDYHACFDLFGASDNVDEANLQYGEWIRAAPSDSASKYLGSSVRGGNRQPQFIFPRSVW
ncbi:hypothetical protein OROMI_018348 [Orobanche minor]